MKKSKSLKLAMNIMLHSRLRSWLTIIGIVIGVAAVVAIMSLGSGMQESLESSLGGLGADIITVSPGASRAMGMFMGGGGRPPEMGGGSSDEDGENLTKKDVQAIRTAENVGYVYGTVSGRGDAYYLGETASLSIEGVDSLIWSKTTNSEAASGRLLSAGDYASVVLGYSVAEDTYKQPLVINRQISIEGKNFKIVGILEEGDNDRSVIMPIEAARDILDDVGLNDFDSITVIVEDEELVDETIEAIDGKLMILRHVNENTKDYTITSSKEMQETISETMSSMILFLTAIAGVSLLVGAVGIANTMFTTVLEKTKEIGIMKAIGARNRDIMTIFVMNSALVGLVGGAIGVTAGGLASSFMTLGMGRTGSSGSMTIELVILGMAIAVGISVGSGIIPAYRASKLKPVDALRYE